ncbi:MAG: hypothetical protein KY456_01095 [Chloroflexi bacterium]|nr:hypothetical protein [Chloroflexota bacterium]
MNRLKDLASIGRSPARMGLVGVTVLIAILVGAFAARSLTDLRDPAEGKGLGKESSLSPGTSPTATPDPTASSSALSPRETASPLATASATSRPTLEPTVAPTPQPASASGFTVAESYGKQQWMSEVIDVIHWNGRFVAVSVSREVMSDATETVVWSSPDGREWTTIPLVLADHPVSLTQLVALGDGTLVLLGALLDSSGGQGVWRGAAWESVNLTQWELTDLGLAGESSAGPPRLAKGPKGYVAASSGALWFSADGVAWERSAERAASTLAAGHDGFVAVHGESDAARAVASGDGRTWYDGDTLPGGGTSVASVGGGDWVAVGGESDMAIWTSPDGLSWVQSTTIRELSGFSSGLGIDTQVTHTPLVTVGNEVYMTLAWNHCCVQLSGGRGVYRSSDGAVWSSLALDDAVVQAGATDGETVVLGGQRGRGAEAILWASD